MAKMLTTSNTDVDEQFTNASENRNTPTNKTFFITTSYSQTVYHLIFIENAFENLVYYKKTVSVNCS